MFCIELVNSADSQPCTLDYFQHWQKNGHSKQFPTELFQLQDEFKIHFTCRNNSFQMMENLYYFISHFSELIYKAITNTVEHGIWIICLEKHNFDAFTSIYIYQNMNIKKLGCWLAAGK